MLEEVRKSYIKAASTVQPDWKTTDVNTLCNLYIDNENDEALRSGYFAGIVLKKWGYIGKHYLSSKNSGFTIDDCYTMVIDAVLYILKSRKWKDPNNKLYGDKDGPDKCLNRCIFSARQRDYYLSNRDKRKINYSKASLDNLMEQVGDHMNTLADQEESITTTDNTVHSLDVKILVTKLFNTNKVIEALIIDNIVNDDCFIRQKDKTQQKSSINSYQTAFKIGKLINNLYGYDINNIKKICHQYAIKEDVVLDYLPLLNNDKYKLSRVVRATLIKLSKSKELRDTLCC